MIRDPDLIRSLLCHVEELDDWLLPVYAMPSKLGSPNTVIGHIKLLEDAGLLERRTLPSGATSGWRLTWNGHEFLDQTRDPEIWEKTKGAAAKLGTSSIPVFMELAIGFLKAKAQSLGLPMM